MENGNGRDPYKFRANTPYDSYILLIHWRDRMYFNQFQKGGCLKEYGKKL